LIQDLDLQALHYSDERKAVEPEYTTDFDPPSTIAAVPNLTHYKANCHCGTVTYTVNIPSLTDQKVISCTCSICSVNGYLNVHAERQEVIFRSGYDHLKTYAFGKMRMWHKFCPTCGSSVMVDLNGIVPYGIDLVAMNVSNTYL